MAVCRGNASIIGAQAPGFGNPSLQEPAKRLAASLSFSVLTPLPPPLVIPAATRVGLPWFAIFHQTPSGTFSLAGNETATIPIAGQGEIALQLQLTFVSSANNVDFRFVIEVGFALGTGTPVIIDEIASEAQAPAGGANLVTLLLIRGNDNRMGVDFEVRGTIEHDSGSPVTITPRDVSLESTYLAFR